MEQAKRRTRRRFISLMKPPWLVTRTRTRPPSSALSPTAARPSSSRNSSTRFLQTGRQSRLRVKCSEDRARTSLAGRKSATACSETGLWPHLYNIWGHAAGARIAHPWGKTTSSRHVHGTLNRYFMARANWRQKPDSKWPGMEWEQREQDQKTLWTLEWSMAGWTWEEIRDPEKPFPDPGIKNALDLDAQHWKQWLSALTWTGCPSLHWAGPRPPGLSCWGPSRRSACCRWTCPPGLRSCALARPSTAGWPRSWGFCPEWPRLFFMKKGRRLQKKLSKIVLSKRRRWLNCTFYTHTCT